MSATKHRARYGKMIPDFAHLNCTRRRELEVKAGAWDECVECPEYRMCFDLGIAQLALHRALRES
jgi:hypothetical protein